MKLLSLEDEYIVDIVCLFKRAEIAFSLSLVNRQFSRVCWPFCNIYGAHWINPLHIDLRQPEDSMITINRGMPLGRYCLKVYGVVIDEETSNEEEYEKRERNVISGNHLVSNMGTFSFSTWQQIPFPEVAAPSSILGFDLIMITCPTLELSDDYDNSPINFMPEGFLAFFNAASGVLQRSENFVYAISFHNMLAKIMLGNSEATVRGFFNAFRGCNHNTGMKIDFSLCSELEDDKSVSRVVEATRRLLDIDVVLEECTYINVRVQNYNSFNAVSFAKWLHFPHKEQTEFGIDDRSNEPLFVPSEINLPDEELRDPTHILNKYFQSDQYQNGFRDFIGLIIENFLSTKCTACSYIVTIDNVKLPNFRMFNDISGEKLQMGKYDYGGSYLCRHEKSWNGCIGCCANITPNDETDRRREFRIWFE